MKLPDKPEFEVVYRLVPMQNQTQGDMVIEGLLTYTSGNENMLAEVREMDVALEDLSAADKRNLLATGVVPSGVRKSSETAQQQVTPQPVEKPTPPINTETSPAAQMSRTETPGQSENNIGDTQVLSASAGVYFRVQVAAHSKPFDGRSFYRKAGVDQEVFVEQHQGLYKYTAGSFTSYSQAETYRKQINRLPEVRGPFIVAYKDGKRVPLSTVLR
jgi:hypothetical protein